MAIKKIEYHKTELSKTIENDSSKEGLSSTFKKSSPKQLLRELIEQNKNTNVQIKIGEWIFDCHFIVLQCYSELFKRLSFNARAVIEIPEEQVSKKIFLIIYKWMITDEPIVQRAEVMELLIAACYLEIEQLLVQIWSCLDDDHLPGDAAFFLYLEANVLQVDCVRKLMLKKISRFFLVLIAFKEFLLMPFKDLCLLIASDALGVNTEIEVFMAILRWLSYDWMHRRKHIVGLMKKVRFCLMPPGYLIELDRNMIGNSIVKRVMARQKVRELVSNGLKYATTRLCYGKLLEENCNTVERHWIYDKNCEYHIQKNQLIEYKITYEKFLNYLAYLQKCEQNYWQKFADIKSEFPSSSRSPGRCCQMPISEIIKETASACIAADVLKTNLDKSSYQEANTTDRNAQHSINRIQEIPMDDEDPINLKSQNRTETAMRYFEKSTSEGPGKQENGNGIISHFERNVRDKSCQYEAESEQHSHFKHLNLEEPQNFEYPVIDLRRQICDCSTSDLDSIDNSFYVHTFHSNIKDKYPWKRKLKKCCTSFEYQKEEICHSSDTSDANSRFLSKLSIDCLSKSYTKESGSSTTSAKSTSKKSIRIESFKKKTIKEESRNRPTEVRQPYLTAKGQKFELKNIELEEIIGNLSISSKTSNSSRKSTSGSSSVSTSQCQSEQEKDEIPINDGAGDAPILNTDPRSFGTFESTRKIFKNKTLLILGGTDPYHQRVRKLTDLNDKVLFYNSRSAKWNQLVHTSFGTRQHHEAVVCNGIVYIIGGTKVIPGCKKTIFETSIWALNIQTKKWTLETNLPRNRRDFAVAAIGDELNEPGFFIIGGESFDRVPLDSVWFYNISRKIWLRKASLNTPRYGLSAAILKNEIWICGGIAYSPNAASTADERSLSARSYTEFITDTMETFRLDEALNRNKGKWRESKYRLRQRCLFGKLLSTKDNRLFLVGGIGNDTNLRSFDSIDCFDFISKNWIECGKLEIGRHGHAVALIDDYIATIGGVSSTQKRALQSVEFFCTTTFRTFNPIPDLPRALSGSSAVVVEEEW